MRMHVCSHPFVALTHTILVYIITSECRSSLCISERGEKKRGLDLESGEYIASSLLHTVALGRHCTSIFPSLFLIAFELDIRTTFWVLLIQSLINLTWSATQKYLPIWFLFSSTRAPSICLVLFTSWTLLEAWWTCMDRAPYSFLGYGVLFSMEYGATIYVKGY